MITLINGFPMNPSGLVVPLGSIKMQLNVDGTVIAPPGGFVAANIPVVFQFDKTGALIQPAKIWSNEELQPQLSSTLLGTFYLVTFYDQNGAVLNATPLWWQFPESLGATVDISQMTPISTVGGNVIYYPTNFGGSGTVTSVAFVGDGVILSATPSTPVTTSGDISATLLTQNSNLVFAGPDTPGPAATPTFRFLTAGDVNPAFANITPATSLANQSSPILIIAGTYWTGSASAVDAYTIQDIISAGATPATTLTFSHTGSGSGSFTFNAAVNVAVLSSESSIQASTDIVMLQTAAATALLNNSSHFFEIFATYWDGAASQFDEWTIQDVLGAGTNPTSTLTFVHTGSSGAKSIDFGGAPFANVGTINATGISVGSSGVNILNAGQVTQQSANNAQAFYGQSSELLTLSTGGTTTDTSANLLPAGAIIDAVVIRITQTISGGSTPTTIAVGDATTSNRFISTGTPLTLGSTAVGLNQMKGGVSTDAAGPVQVAAAKVRVTLDQTPGQGIVRITVFWRQYTAPTS